MEIKYVVAPVLTLLAACQAQNTCIPYELGGDNCDAMYGSPDISASVSGTDEFECGDTVMLYVDLTNYRKISGFKEDQTLQNPKEFALANSELGKMQKKAWGIVTFFFREPEDPSDSNIELERYG
ncbi:MAG: hypothetical protein LUQ51_01015 [Methanothrix sp.]|nr:hypothetical protein [Methanothrix sp.]OYV13985.1 MAG: hypothetical protein CG446_10 [Methanosaeta sp. ASO1]